MRCFLDVIVVKMWVVNLITVRSRRREEAAEYCFGILGVWVRMADFCRRE